MSEDIIKVSLVAKRCGLAIAPWLSTSLVSVEGAKGVAVAYPSGCNHYIVETDWDTHSRSGSETATPHEGDILAENFESYGMKTMHILNRDRETRVWVEDCFMSGQSAMEEYLEHCG